MTDIFDDFESSYEDAENQFMFDSCDGEFLHSSAQEAEEDVGEQLAASILDQGIEQDAEDLYVVSVLTGHLQELQQDPVPCAQYQLRLQETTSLLELHQYICKQQKLKSDCVQTNKFFFYFNAAQYGDFIESEGIAKGKAMVFDRDIHNFPIPLSTLNGVRFGTVSGTSRTNALVPLYGSVSGTAAFSDYVHPVVQRVKEQNMSSMLQHPFFTVLRYEYSVDMKLHQLAQFERLFEPNRDALSQAKGGSPRDSLEDVYGEDIQDDSHVVHSVVQLTMPATHFSPSLRQVTLSGLPVRRLRVPVTVHANEKQVKNLVCTPHTLLKTMPIHVYTQEYGMLYLEVSVTEPQTQLEKQITLVSGLDDFLLTFQDQILNTNKSALDYQLFRNCQLLLIDPFAKLPPSVRARIESCVLFENVHNNIYSIHLNTRGDSVCTTTVPLIVLRIDNESYSHNIPLLDMQKFSQKTSTFLIDTDSGELVPSAILPSTNAYTTIQQQIGWEHLTLEQYQTHIQPSTHTFLLKPNNLLVKGKLYSVCINYANYPYYFNQRRWKHIGKMKTKLDPTILEYIQQYEDSVSATRLPFLETQDKERILKPLFFQFICQ